MPVLNNPQHERFARELAKGQPAIKAYVLAGYKESPASASRLSKQVNIVDRVAEIQASLKDEVVHRTGIDKDWVISKLVENVDRAMQAVPVLDAEGEQIGEWRYQGTVAIKALDLIGRELGMFADRTRIDFNIKASEAFLAALDRLALQTKKPIMIEGEKVE